MRWISLGLILTVAACGDNGSIATSAGGNPDAALSLGRDAAPPTVFNVVLRAENEPNGASTSESKGTAQLKVLEDGTIEFLLTVNNKGDETFTRAHIHKAPAGSNGGIHWDLLEAGVPVPSIDGQPAQLRGEARARAGADLADLLANPDQYYVNAHSTAFPGGAIRGQLR